MPGASWAARDRCAARWSVVHTQPHRERRAHAHLLKQGFRSFLPLYGRTVRHARQFRTSLAPLFPRYLFVELTIGIDRWTSIRGTFGVSHLVMDGEVPRAVPRGVVEGLLHIANSDGVVGLGPTLVPGQSIRLSTGPFAGLVGKLSSLDDNGRVKVLLDVLGKEVLVTAESVGLVPAA